MNAATFWDISGMELDRQCKFAGPLIKKTHTGCTQQLTLADPQQMA